MRANERFSVSEPPDGGRMMILHPQHEHHGSVLFTGGLVRAGEFIAAYTKALAEGLSTMQARAAALAALPSSQAPRLAMTPEVQGFFAEMHHVLTRTKH